MNNLVRGHSRAPVALWRSVCTLKDATSTIDAKVVDGAVDRQVKIRESAFDKLGVPLGGATTLSRQRSVIDSLGATTFTVSGVRVSGSLLVMPTFSTLWNVNSLEDISPLSFTLIKLSNPRPDLVLIGTGSVMKPIPRDTRRFLAELGVGVEVSDTKNACQTFNVLNQEFRNVAAAIVPMQFSIE